MTDDTLRDVLAEIIQETWEATEGGSFTWQEDADAIIAALAARSVRLQAADAREDGLRETLLDIGSDHEGHRLVVSRGVDNDDGSEWWVLYCEQDEEDGALLDLAALAARNVRLQAADAREDGLRAQLEAADEPAYRHIMNGSFVKDSILVGTILPEWLKLRLLDALAAREDAR